MGYLGRVPSPVPVTADDIPANSIDASKIVDGAITNADINASAGIAASKLSGIPNNSYIKSGHTSINATYAATGENNDIDLGCSLDMGTANSASSVYIITGSAQLHLDYNNSGDTGGGAGIGVQVKIGTGNWTTIYDQGRWGNFDQGNDDMNMRTNISSLRYAPNTTLQVQFRLVGSTHRRGASFMRQPAGSTGGQTRLMVMEFSA